SARSEIDSVQIVGGAGADIRVDVADASRAADVHAQRRGVGHDGGIADVKQLPGIRAGGRAVHAADGHKLVIEIFISVQSGGGGASEIVGVSHASNQRRA